MARSSAQRFILGCLLTGFALVGCQHAPTPTAPGAQQTPLPPAASAGASGIGTLGFAKLSVRAGGSDVRLALQRTGTAIGDTFPLDATDYLNGDPCTDCMRMTSFSLNGNTLDLDIEIRHPFPSTQNREDLDVFDPRVVLFAPKRSEWNYFEFPELGPYPRPNLTGGGSVPTLLAGNTTLLSNADGYTTHFDERVDTLTGLTLEGNLNPYKNYALDLLPNDAGSGQNPNRRMSQTRGPEVQTFKVNLPTTVEFFDAYLLFEVNYGQSATKFTRHNPLYYLPEFNQKEAYDVTIRGAVATPSAGLTYGSAWNLLVTAKDWQQNALLDLTYPNSANLSGIHNSSRINDVRVAIPGWTQSFNNVPLSSSGTGTDLSPFIYVFTLPRDVPYPPRINSTLPMIVQVRDELYGQAIGNSNPAFDIGQTYDVAAYQIATLKITFPAAPTLEPPSPPMLVADTTASVRTAPYPGAQEGASQVEPVYPTGAEGVFSVPPTDLRLLLADSSGKFRLFNPVNPTAATPLVDYANGVKPYDDYPASPNAHPNPNVTMPVFSFGADPNGSFMAGFGDDNFTLDPLRFSTGLTDRVANSAVAAAWYQGVNGLTPGARLSDGCGSAPGPSLGGRLRGVLSAPDTAIGNWNHLLGYISAGKNSEACGDYARVEYYGTPYSSNADRALTVNLYNVAVDLFGASPTDTNFRSLARLVPLRYDPVTKKWPHLAFYNNRVVSFDAFENFDPTTRTSFPAAGVARSTGLEAVIDVCFIPYESRSPFWGNGVTQAHDWVAILVRSVTEYRLLIADTSNIGGVLVSDWGGSLPGWGAAFPLISDMDFDPVNRYLVFSYDSNGVSAGGNIQTTLLGVQ